MARRHKHEEHINHERWLVSYADFVTLLFAFFVVMYAISSVNEGKYRVLSDALVTAFGKAPDRRRMINPNELGQQAGIPPMWKRKHARLSEMLRREQDRLRAVAQDIVKALNPLVQTGKVRVSQTARGVAVEINASVLFAPGDATLDPAARPVLESLASVLKSDTHEIEVQGHTDDVPISNAVYPSNWELSSARASSVVRLFTAQGMAPERLSAIGHAANIPLDDNATESGRARNRRVEVLVVARTLPILPTLMPDLAPRDGVPVPQPDKGGVIQGEPEAGEAGGTAEPAVATEAGVPTMAGTQSMEAPAGGAALSATTAPPPPDARETPPADPAAPVASTPVAPPSATPPAVAPASAPSPVPAPVPAILRSIGRPRSEGPATIPESSPSRAAPPR